METLSPTQQKGQVPLRAFVEIVDGQLKIFPIADSDEDERCILDAFRFVVEGLGGR